MSETPSQPETPSPKASWLGRLVSNPFFALANLMLSIGGLGAAFYFAGREAKQLTYYVDPVRTAVVRASAVPNRLTVYHDSATIENDVTAAQVAIWNMGGEAIKAEDMLSQLTISTENNTPILEAGVKKSGREVAPLKTNTEGLRQGRVTVDWRILERNDGGVIQLLYAGGPATNILVHGIVIGQGPVIEQRRGGGKAYEIIKYIVAVLAMLCAVAIPLIWLRDQRNNAESGGAQVRAGWLFRAVTASAVAMMAALICLHFITLEPAPPFGF